LDGALGRGALSTTADSHCPGNAVRGILLLARSNFVLASFQELNAFTFISLSQFNMVLRNWPMEHINLHGKYF
jgi:hypothetical protein